MKLSLALVVSLVSVLSPAGLHADEHGSVTPTDVAIERLESEMLSHYLRGGGEPTEPEKNEGSEIGLQRAQRPGAGSLLEKQTAEKIDRERRELGTRLLASSLVAQWISLGTTFATIVPDLAYFAPANGVLQLGTIPFAYMGVAGFARRYGGATWAGRMEWTGIGLLQASGHSAMMGLLNVLASRQIEDPFWHWFIYGPAIVSHFVVAGVFLVAAPICVVVSHKARTRLNLSRARHSSAKGSRRFQVVPTIGLRMGGLSLGLTGTF